MDKNAPDGKKMLWLGPCEGWQGCGMPLNLRASCKFRIGVMAHRLGDNGKIYRLVRLRSSRKGWQYHVMQFPRERFNEWLKLESEFVMQDDLAELDAYLYNMNSKELSIMTIFDSSSLMKV